MKTIVFENSKKSFSEIFPPKKSDKTTLETIGSELYDEYYLEEKKEEKNKTFKKRVIDERMNHETGIHNYTVLKEKHPFIEEK